MRIPAEVPNVKQPRELDSFPFRACFVSCSASFVFRGVTPNYSSTRERKTWHLTASFCTVGGGV